MSIVSDAYSWGDLPYVYKSPESAQQVFNDPVIAESISNKMRADTGTVVLGHIEVGGFRLLINTKRPLKSPADIDGMKFRMLSNPIDEALLSSWGASPDAVERSLRVHRATGWSRCRGAKSSCPSSKAWRTASSFSRKPSPDSVSTR